MQARLLVVEDDETIRETIRDSLELEGFAVTACGNGRDALQTLQRAPEGEGYALVVLDLMLPGLGGLDVCRQLRSANDHTPILVVSARDSETDRVLGLEVGADDYLIKPFGMRELVARCRALLRRSQPAEPGGDRVLEHVWGHDYFGDSKTVDVHIRWLREKLEANPSAPEHLQTVRGFGYRFG